MKKNSPELVGVIHLPALDGAVSHAVKRAVEEARILEAEGFDGLIIENFGDVPFFKDRVPPVTVSAMSVIAQAVRDKVRISMGINVLRNDAHAALAIAAVTGAQFIRVNVLSGVAATDQGIIEGDAANLMRERDRTASATGAQRPDVWADILVKHARSLSGDDPALAAEEAVLRAGADAIIVTGATTGRPVDMDRLRTVARLKLAPVYCGSGATPENVAALRPYLHGVIVSSALRKGGKAGAPLEASRVRAFAKAWRATTSRRK